MCLNHSFFDGNLVLKNKMDNNNNFQTSLRVLAVDDNIVCLEMLVVGLQQCGYEGMLHLIRSYRRKILKYLDWYQLEKSQLSFLNQIPVIFCSN